VNGITIHLCIAVRSPDESYFFFFLAFFLAAMEITPDQLVFLDH
jgi:hypothetical protein